MTTHGGRMRSTALGIICLTGVAVSAGDSRPPAPVHLPPGPPEQHAGNVLVRFKPAAIASAENRLRRLIPTARMIRTYRAVAGLSLVEVPDGTVAEAVTALQADPSVAYAEPDYIVHLDAVPDDPFLDRLWGMRNVGQTVNGDPGRTGADARVVESWDHWVGDPDFRIAVIDTGVNYNHRDLFGNMWVNGGEIRNNGIDDDGNGWVDDFFGYDTEDDDGDPIDENGHGSHVAGVIAAVGDNGLGVVGINWRARIVAIRFGNETGTGTISDAIQALDYVIDNGIRLSNNSWGCDRCFSQALYDAIEATQAVDHLFVTSAGNGFLGLGLDAAQFPTYPASYDLPNIIAVGAIDNNDKKAKFSNYGKEEIDLAAPGVNVFSTLLGGDYGFLSGTSMAAPHVTGAAALLMSRLPELSSEAVKERLLRTARPVPTLQGITVTGGVLHTLAATADCNGNGRLDRFDISGGFSADCNHNTLPDECEPDCNQNGVADECDVDFAAGTDCDQNGVPDECEPDCNGNGTADECDVAAGSSFDCNDNRVPDECEPGATDDCNENGIPDLCDLSAGDSRDCNHNDVPDICDVRSNHSVDCSRNGLPDECERDCNLNGIADSCDLHAGRSVDLDGDGVPDECTLGIALVPVSASVPHVIDDQRVTVVEGGGRLTFEMRILGWDPDQDGSPVLRLYEIIVGHSVLGEASDGALKLAVVPCEDNDDCLAASICEPDGVCDELGAIGLDESNPDWVFYGLNTISGSDSGAIRVGALVFDDGAAPIDTGDPKYAGTLIVDVSPSARGSFTIELDAVNSFFMGEGDARMRFPGSLAAQVQIDPDCNGNGISDSLDMADGRSEDCDGDGIPDECVEDRRDCNDNDRPDQCDLEDGTSPDCNGNRIPDECIELEFDCNRDGLPDPCEIADGLLDDCNGNGVPDVCISLEDDCNATGTPDECDLVDGTSSDCNGNGTPDECDEDCNGNRLADECDISTGSSADDDMNGVPDECQVTLRVPQDFATIQRAIHAADPGDTVLVAPGTYSGKGNVELEFFGSPIRLACAGAARTCIIDATGADAGVIFAAQESRDTVLEGFTIRGAGNAGIVCAGANPVIRDCTITGNGPISSGILCTDNAAPLIDRCTMTRNAAAFSGGGIRCIRSRPLIRNSTIDRNVAVRDGGGIYAFASNLVIEHCRVTNNNCRGDGGGIAIHHDAPVVRACVVSGNEARSPAGQVGNGGGLAVRTSEALVASCVITGNVAGDLGGGVYFERGDPVLTNTTVVGNSAGGAGGGVYHLTNPSDVAACCLVTGCSQDHTLATCVLAGGTFFPGVRCRDVECGARACCLPDGSCENLNIFECNAAGGSPRPVGSQCLTDDCNPTVRNSIVWDNRAPFGANVFNGETILDIADSIVEGGWVGINVSTVDPGFRAVGFWNDEDQWVEGDYQPMLASPAVDHGNNATVPGQDRTDVAGRVRILCGTVDLGAFETGAGDFNCDQSVNLEDYRAWVACLRSAGAVYGPGCEAFDADADGDIDLFDFATFQNTAGTQ